MVCSYCLFRSIRRGIASGSTYALRHTLRHTYALRHTHSFSCVQAMYVWNAYIIELHRLIQITNIYVFNFKSIYRSFDYSQLQTIYSFGLLGAHAQNSLWRSIAKGNFSKYFVDMFLEFQFKCGAWIYDLKHKTTFS